MYSSSTSPAVTSTTSVEDSDKCCTAHLYIWKANHAWRLKLYHCYFKLLLSRLQTMRVSRRFIAAIVLCVRPHVFIHPDATIFVYKAGLLRPFHVLTLTWRLEAKNVHEGRLMILRWILQARRPQDLQALKPQLPSL